MNPYIEIHQTLDDFEQALFSDGGATDFDALHHVTCMNILKTRKGRI